MAPGLSSGTVADRLQTVRQRCVTIAVWHREQRLTFSAILAARRRHIWHEQGLLTSRQHTNSVEP